MDYKSDILIVGGGLAGLTSALHLHKAGLKVILIEKNTYPHHKVCGEYISNEVLPYLTWLNIDIEKLNPTHINQLQLTTQAGKSISTVLPLGGFGISRYTLDHHLYLQLIARGIQVFNENVIDINYEDDYFLAKTTNGLTFMAKQVVGAYGKRSTLDIKFERPFIKTKSSYLAVKAHYKGEFPDDLVALHNFKGGYCGVSKVEDNKINICYLANYETFKNYKSIDLYQREVLSKNQYLKDILTNSEMLFETPITISQLYFGTKQAITNHILMVGDTAGLIHPLCGNGMAMAINSAKIAAELLIKYFNGEIVTRDELEKKYAISWNSFFKSRLKMGSLLSSLMRKEKLADFSLNILAKTPYLLNQIIKRTHGKPLLNND
ncbi:MAG: NAD(P)/FAD-dependent oxidoreductase [Pedobacter sp.]|nr:MAG: NAD(P)/FAD-dependent oxidoreductase [Pedobacter sp.]